MPWIDAPTCEACWIKQHSVWEPLPDGSADRLISIRTPVRVLHQRHEDGATIESCHYCGELTISGIYQRALEPIDTAIDDK